MNKQNILEKFLLGIIAAKNIDAVTFLQFQRKFAKENATSFQNKDELLKVYQKMVQNGTIKSRHDLEKVLQMKNVRSQSGIAVVSVLTKPYPCPGKCIYCPTEKNVPKSYLSNEPAVMRAIANQYHPYKQVISRLKALNDIGHITDKISIRIIGGTWSYYPKGYQSWFIRNLYKACNEFGGEKSIRSDLYRLQQQNQTANSRIVELSIETREDFINNEELARLRKYGVTKVEIGVQSLDNQILKANNRGSNIENIAKATRLLKDWGFKVSYQMMLNLYQSSPEKDIDVFKELFENEKYCPDHLKIYPLALAKNTELYKKYKAGEFKAYNRETLIHTIAEIKIYVPKYCRIERVIRDIPASEIVEGGAKISNLRQEIEKELKQTGIKCQCIRCREIKGKYSSSAKLNVFSYQASGAEEYFIEMADGNHLIGFCRMRMNKSADNQLLDQTAVIREIHVYGPTVGIGEISKNGQQHRGYGKRMIEEAEIIARLNSYTKIAVIAGVGVRKYFESLGYSMVDSYMVKELHTLAPEDRPV